MARKRKKRKNILHSTFYRAYFAIVIVCLIGIGIGARWLNGLLADYETSQPVHVAEQAVRMFEDADYETIYDYDTSAATLSGDRDFYVQSMHEIADGREVRWAEGYSPNADERIYNVLLGDEKFAEIALAPSGQKSRHGFTLWTLDSVTTLVTMGEQSVEPEVSLPEEEPEEVPAGIACRITVPSDSTVVVDGTALTPDDVTAAEIPVVPDGMLPEDVAAPTLTEYTVYSETGAPQIAVTDRSGNPQEVVPGDEYSWSCGLPEDAQLKEQYEGPVVEVAKRLASCAAKTVSKDSMLRYCAKGSPAYAAISNFDASTGASTKPEKFENIVTSDYHQYSDTCFSCHVSFDYISKFTVEVIKTYPTTFTLYFVMKDGVGRLYNFTLY